MEEEKAAAYYDELLRKGSNAARFKQGLGFGKKPSEVSIDKSDAHGSLTNFVKEASPGRAAAIQTEIKVESIRLKLKKKEGSPSKDKDRHRKQELASSLDQERPSRRGIKPRSRRRSLSSDSEGYSSSSDRSPRDGSHRSRKRRHRTSSPSQDSKNSGKERHRSWQRESPDRSRSRATERSRRDRRRSSSNSGQGRRSDRRGHRQLSRRDHSRSPDRSQRRDKSLSPIGRRSPRHGPGNGRRGRSSPAVRGRERRRRSISTGRDRRSISVERERKRRARTPTEERERESGRWRNEQRGRSWSPNLSTHYGVSRRHDRRTETVMGKGVPKRQHGSQTKITESERDYAKLIPNFDFLTPAEKVKAKMKLQLSETVVKDSVKGMTGEWERFEFNKDAPLDDDAKLDYFGDGTGARDDTGFMRNTGSTLLSTSHQARREAQIQAAHEAAIFGAPVGPSTDTPEVRDGKRESGRRLQDSDKRSNERNFSDEESAKGEVTPGNGVISEQVITMQSGGSWQERARKMREAWAAAGT